MEWNPGNYVEKNRLIRDPMEQEEPTREKRAKEHFRLSDQRSIPIPRGDQSILTRAIGKEVWQEMERQGGLKRGEAREESGRSEAN